MDRFDVMSLSPGVKSGIIWSLASDLYRFHGRAMDLHLSVVRPGGGQYLCLFVKSGRTGRALFWNIGGTSAQDGTGNEFLGSGHAQGRYLHVALTQNVRALLAPAEEALRCEPRPPKPEKTDARALCFRAIAALMRQRMFWEGEPLPLLSDSGLGDSSGMDGIWVQSFIKRFPVQFEEASAAVRAGDFATASRIANRFWLLRAGDIDLVINTETAIAIEAEGTQTDLWRIYEERHRDVWAVVAFLDHALRPRVI